MQLLKNADFPIYQYHTLAFSELGSALGGNGALGISSGTLNQLVCGGYGMNRTHIFPFVTLAMGIHSRNAYSALPTDTQSVPGKMY